MAFKSREKSGTVRIWFTDAEGKRKSVRIGKVDDDAAIVFCDNLQALANASLTNTEPRSHVVAWVMGLPAVLQDRLARVGLIEIETKDAVPALGAYFDEYIANRKAGESSKTVWRRARRHICDHIGTDRLLDSVTVGDALRWRDAMLSKPLAEATVRKMTQVGRQVFKRALKEKLVTSNPFLDEDLPVVVGEREKEYVDITVIERLCEHMPSLEWQAVLILARVAGLRVQSEGPLLKWGHVDWSGGRLSVTDPKRKKTRSVSLFPQLREVLERLYEQAERGEEFILPTVRTRSNNWGTPLKKWMRKAGVEPWAALFNSMRSSAETDIAREFGVHLAGEWVGNSVKVALKHYVRSTEADYERANKKSGAICGAQKAPNGTNPEHDTSGQNVPQDRRNGSQTLVKKGVRDSSSNKKGAPAACAETPSDGRYWT